MRRFFEGLLCLGAASASSWAQSSKPASHEVDVAITYNAERRNLNTGGSFWEQGGSADVSGGLYRGLGLAAIVSGGHANNIGGSSISLTTVTFTAGPRYTWSRQRWAVFAEGTVGASGAFNTVIPYAGGPAYSASSFAAQAGGGMDVRVSPHFAVRVVQAGWLHTEIPNGTTNAQDSLELGAGIVFRLHR